jgi:DNA-directed RNA polymerase specialized sigma24 family protein
LNDPHVEFQYPREPGDETAESARDAGRGESWRLLLDMLAGCRNPRLRIAALRYLGNPRERSVAQIAKELGVARITVHRELRTVKAFRFLSDVTPSTE